MSESVMSLSEHEQQAKTHAMIAYILMLLGYFTGFLSLVAFIWALIKKSDAKGTPFEDHYSNVIKTFVVAVIGSIVGVFTLFFVVGYFILLGVFIWTLYRLIKGVIRLSDNKSFYGI